METQPYKMPKISEFSNIARIARFPAMSLVDGKVLGDLFDGYQRIAAC